MSEDISMLSAGNEEALSSQLPHFWPLICVRAGMREQKNILESILEYEQLIADIEEGTSSKYPEELKSATLLRCTEQRVREFLQLSVTDSNIISGTAGGQSFEK